MVIQLLGSIEKRWLDELKVAEAQGWFQIEMGMGMEMGWRLWMAQRNGFAHLTKTITTKHKTVQIEKQNDR